MSELYSLICTALVSSFKPSLTVFNAWLSLQSSDANLTFTGNRGFKHATIQCEALLQCTNNPINVYQASWGA
jgi:hypothetical protein